VKVTQFARAGATGKTPVKTRWPSFFGNSVRVIEQRFDISFCEVLELQKYGWWDIGTQFLFSEVN
jgi:hypothetical protein